MENVFLLMVIVLIILAISDLIVGVSNDAVNFLNSAVGAKVAPLGLILMVAAAGILIGTTFSSGMMEVARKGIFNPGSFSFYNIMIIFLAVMLTDVLLLDLFNTFGLPTSTTVSIVFELLGGAVGIAILSLTKNGEDLSELGNYINSARALAIIFGILISIVIAFSIGAVIQYLSRLLFTFNFERTMKYFGALWGGIALTFITYFILIKGAKGISFMTDETIGWIISHTLLILGISLAGWTIIFQFLHWIFHLNILKFIVLAGTFALAMAFAGNDLVNFIGVPLAGYESYKIFSAAQGASAGSFMMSSLAGEIKTPTLYLLTSGLIMVITLWVSRKARTVIKTTVNLSDQDVIEERFESSLVARAVVRQAIKINKTIQFFIPAAMAKRMAKRFDPKPFKEYVKKNPGVSFDLIRASVNLVVASILIAFGTSLKLPLSTTYVTFMVAMGSSLADGAWGRESAVYRITGVVTVVGGWFFTAISAFTVSLLLALILYWTNLLGLIVLIPLAILLIIKTHAIHSKKSKDEIRQQERSKALTLDGESIYESCSATITSMLLASSKTLSQSLESLMKEKHKKLKEDVKIIKELNKEAKSLKKEVPRSLQKLTEESFESGHSYIEIIDYMRDMMHCLTYIVNPSYEHVDNNHTPLTEFQTESLKEISKAYQGYINDIVASITTSDYSQQGKQISNSQVISEMITKARKKDLKLFKKEPGSTRTNMLFLDILAEMKNLILHVNNIYKAFRDFSENNRKVTLKEIQSIQL